MIRVVPTGDLGLDVLLGGGWRLVKRFEDLESATVVVRGGSGAGKTLVGIQVALELAKALGGDVVVGCVEILPTEYIAQLQSARPSYEGDRVAMLPQRAGSEASPRIYVGLLTELDPARPDLVDSLDKLDEVAIAAGAKPKVFVIDSLIEGYGIGSSAPRIDVDDVLRFAARYGYGLVLCEEVGNETPSPWVFAADTVLQLGVDSRDRGRWIEVRKHRFGPSATGRHDLELKGASGPEVFPAMDAWLPSWVPRVLLGHGWRLNPQRFQPAVFGWSSSPDLDGALFLINADAGGPAGPAAATLFRVRGGFAESNVSFVLWLDPLSHVPDHWKRGEQRGISVPVALGPVRAIRRMVEGFAAVCGGGRPANDRVLVGDLAQVLSLSDAEAWVDAVRRFATLVAVTGWAVPVIAYDSRSERRGVAREQLLAYADTVVALSPWDSSTGRVATQILHRGMWRVAHLTIPSTDVIVDAPPRVIERP